MFLNLGRDGGLQESQLSLPQGVSRSMMLTTAAARGSMSPSCCLLRRGYLRRQVERG